LGSTNAEDLERSIKQDRFGVRKGFQGTEGGESSSGPVEFERETLGKSTAKVDKDVFGLDTFLNKAKKGKRAREDDDSDDDRRKR
jgi:SNW domain-containing protein 1